MKFTFMFCFLLCNVMMARGVKDSTRWDYRMKGIDFNFGFSNVLMGKDHDVKLLEAITPEEDKYWMNYDEAELQGRSGYAPFSVRVAAVLSNNNDNYRFFLAKKELKVGLGFEIDNANRKTVNNIRYRLNLSSSDTAILNYTYQCQYIQAGYQFASKPFLRYFALFVGVDARFGMNTYKRIETAYRRRIGGRSPENYNVGYFSAGLNAGLKYNFSCDLNFFIQYEGGMNVYGGNVSGNAVFSAFGFGMRYKIIDDQDRPKYELMKY